MQIEFSVLICVYKNDDPVIFEKALNSILINSKKPSQIVLVIDGEIYEKTEQIIHALRTNPVLDIVRIAKNVGLARALNIGLERVVFDVVFRADADDINSIDRFEKQLPYLTNGYQLVGSAIQEVDSKGANVAIRSMPSNYKDIVAMLGYRNPFNHMTVGFLKSAVVECGGYPNLYLKEDYGLWVVMLSKGFRAANLNDVLVVVSAGDEMYKRRGGWKYVQSEIGLHSHLLEHGFAKPFRGIGILICRSFVFLLPSSVRGIIYLKFLRK